MKDLIFEGQLVLYEQGNDYIAPKLYIGDVNFTKALWNHFVNMTMDSISIEGEWELTLRKMK